MVLGPIMCSALRTPPPHTTPPPPTPQMHVRSDIALVKGGEVASVLTTEPEGMDSFLPQLFSVSPLAATCGKERTLSLEIKASGLGGPSSSILCGLGGAPRSGAC